MEKVTYKELRNALVHVDNSVDTAKVYDIAADVRLQGQNTVEAFESPKIWVSMGTGRYIASVVPMMSADPGIEI